MYQSRPRVNRDALDSGARECYKYVGADRSGTKDEAGMKAVTGIPAVAAASLAAIALFAGAAEPAELVSLRATIATAHAQIEEDFNAQKVAADGRYGKHLDAVCNALREHGDLDGCLNVEAEKKRFEAEKTVPRQNGEKDLHPLVLKALSLHEESVARAGTTKIARLTSLYKGCLTALKGLNEELAAQGMAEEAKVVRDEISKTERTIAELSASQKPTQPGAAKPPANPAGLVLCYSFGTNQSDIAVDESGLRHNGAVHGATWVVDGVAGGAYRFDGKADFIEAAATPDLSPGTGSFTLAMWVRLGERAETEAFAGSRGWAPKTAGYSFDTGNGLRFQVYTAGGKVHTALAPLTVPRGRWVHIAVVREAKGTAFYVDGQRSDGGGGLDNVDIQLDGPLLIGARGVVGDAPAYAAGCIDEVVVYRRALAADEVAAIVRAGGAARPDCR